jgi:hypothetical protein
VSWLVETFGVGGVGRPAPNVWVEPRLTWSGKETDGGENSSPESRETVPDTFFVPRLRRGNYKLGVTFGALTLTAEVLSGNPKSSTTVWT